MNPDRLSNREYVRALGFALTLIWRADRVRLAGMAVVQLCTSLGLGALVLVARAVFGQVLGGGTKPSLTDVGQLVPAFGFVLAITVASGLLFTVSQGWQRVLSVKVDRHIIAMVLESATRTDLAEFERPAFHDRLYRAVIASRAQPMVLVGSLMTVVQAAASMIAVAGAFALMAWWLLPFTVLAMVPVLKTARAERNARFGLHRELAEERRSRNYLEGLLTGLDEAKEIRALNLGRSLRDRWNAQYEREIGRTTQIQRVHTARKIIGRLVSGAVTAAAIGLVWWLVTTNSLRLADALATLTALWMLSSRTQMLGYLMNSLGETILYVADLRTFTGRPADPDIRSTTTDSADQGFRTLEAVNIGFTYHGSTRPALSGVSVSLARGEIVAIVGKNGSGKTTLAKILAGLYPPSSGTLRRDGIPVTDVRSLRETTAVLFQDFVRFKTSAADNIAFGQPARSADDERIDRAARQVGADEFIARLPAAYQTLLSKEFTGGVDLSLGQWQRLALARAFYRDAPFVILDEPTASLDPQAEADLFDHLRELFAGRTVLIISHRFSTVRAADRIYVVDSGVVQEQGTHESLMIENGTYARLFHLQARQYQHETQRT